MLVKAWIEVLEIDQKVLVIIWWKLSRVILVKALNLSSLGVSSSV